MVKQPIFITGRFRAGTSFLWQMFDRLPQFCAWYEPLHPQLPSHVAHIKPKADHVGIEDYWRSYHQHPEFIEHFNSDFAHNSLWLEADSSYPELKRYIDNLITLSGAQQPVLQFNRMDFRLPWLKANYPNAIIIHISRKPMQLWHSQRKHLSSDDRNNPSVTDAYELMQSSVALSSLLPFLAKRNHPHAFFRCFVLQKLSDLMGERVADVSISLEADVFESDEFATILQKYVGLNTEDWLGARQAKHVPAPIGLEVNEMSTLSKIMMEVDELLNNAGLLEGCGISSLADIKHDHPLFWEKQIIETEWLNEEMLHAMAAQQSELTDLMATKNKLADALKQQKNNE